MTLSHVTTRVDDSRTGSEATTNMSTQFGSADAKSKNQLISVTFSLIFIPKSQIVPLTIEGKLGYDWVVQRTSFSSHRRTVLRSELYYRVADQMGVPYEGWYIKDKSLPLINTQQHQNLPGTLQNQNFELRRMDHSPRRIHCKFSKSPQTLSFQNTNHQNPQEKELLPSIKSQTKSGQIIRMQGQNHSYEAAIWDKALSTYNSETIRRR